MASPAPAPDADAPPPPLDKFVEASSLADTSAAGPRGDLPIAQQLQQHAAAISARKALVAKRDAALKEVAVAPEDADFITSSFGVSASLAMRLLQEEGGDRAATARRLVGVKG